MLGYEGLLAPSTLGETSVSHRLGQSSFKHWLDWVDFGSATKATDSKRHGRLCVSGVKTFEL